MSQSSISFTPKAEARELPSLLDRLVGRGAHWLMRSRLRDAVNASLPQALKMILGVALVALAGGAMESWFALPWPSLWIFFLLALALPVAWVGSRLLAVLREHPTREEALAIYDERLHLEDRLRTADAFLRQTAPSPFVQAAVADALPAAEQASDKDLFWAWGESPWEWRLGILPLLALLCLLGATFLPAYRPGDEASLDQEIAVVADLPSELSQEGAPPKPETPLPEEKVATTLSPNKQAQRPPQGVAPALSEPNPSEKVVEDDEVKETEGMSEGGQHSDAKSSGRSDRSQGAPGNQSPASKPAEQKKPKKRSEKKKPNNKPMAKSQKKVKDRSGATSGRGSSSGSSRNPASTDWSSKDRVEETEDQELEQEDEVDDEETESEARGGLQPNLRDRRPPVNRDLSIGFGNRSNPDANGRGGPGQRKKSRGVASLVLGVPVPDHVKGQVNPGRVKITQERIQPKAERAEAVPGESRGEREDPYGVVPQRSIEPEMKRLVREFFQRDLDES